MFKKIFGGGGGPAAARGAIRLPAVDPSIAANMHYNVYYWRTHTDVRPGLKLLLVHDWLSTCQSWCPLVGAIQRSAHPAQEDLVLAQQPLTLLCPDLPNHGKSAASDSLSHPAEYAAALVEFVQRVVRDDPVHIVGFGVGGTQIGLLAAAGMPARNFGSFTALVGEPAQQARASKPLLLDPSISAEDLTQTCGKGLTSLHQVDAFFAARPAAAALSDAARFNTGTSHCAATRWRVGINRKGTPSYEAASESVRWASNVRYLRTLPDYGAEVASSCVELIEQTVKQQQAPAWVGVDNGSVRCAVAAASCFNVMHTLDGANSPAAELVHSAFRGWGIVPPASGAQQDDGVAAAAATEEANKILLPALDCGARGPMQADVDCIAEPFLQLFSDPTAGEQWRMMMAQQQQQQQQA